jgi:hypothetical protein
MIGPPNEAGGTGDAAHENLPLAKKLPSAEKEINSDQIAAWGKELERLLREYSLTGKRKHFDALATHVSGMRERLGRRSARHDANT